MATMFQITIIFILFLVSGCASFDGGTQPHTPADVLKPEAERLDYPLWRWSGNGLFSLESAACKFEYDMLGHPVIETGLDSVYACSLIFDTEHISLNLM